MKCCTLITAVFVACGPLVACGETVSLPAQDCSPSLELYERDPWSEPQRGSLSANEENLHAPQSGWNVSYRFATESNAGNNFTYWLTGSEDMILNPIVGYGMDHDEPDQLTFYVFLDGLQARPRDEADVPHDYYTVEFAPGDVHAQPLRIPGAEMSDGGHSASVLLSRRRYNDPLLSYPVTVLKNSAEFAERPAALEGTEVAPDPQDSHVALAGMPFALLRGDLAMPPDGGELPLDFLVKSISVDCIDLVRRLVVVALLDGVQIEIPEYGLRPAFELPPSKQVEFTATMTGLPVDGSPHKLEFWILPGDGQYTEAPEGQLSPWFESPSELGWATWQ